MRSARFRSHSDSSSVPRFGSRTATKSLLLLLLFSVAAPSILAQQAGETVVVDKQTLQNLLQRIDRLEARVTQLEAARSAAGPFTPMLIERSVPGTTIISAPPSPVAPAAPKADAEPQEEHMEPEKMDVSKTLLNIRGFGDFGLYGGNQKGQTTSFSLGELNLFVTSNISEKFKFLSELVFESESAEKGQINVFKAEPERVLLEYSFSDYFNLSAGRFHSAIGYYNTAYHHSTWLQTTIDRPFLFTFEDEGGILPIHNVGLSASGEIPSGSLGLHYVAEVGNGRAARTDVSDPVQNVVAEDNHKSVNVELFARPDWMQGLQTGFSLYHDVLYPNSTEKVGENIFDAYAVLTRTNFEWLNEALLIRHSVQGGHVFDTPGFYSQISERFGSFRPYLRYQYVNASNNEPLFPDAGLQAGPSVGIRYDASQSVALKLQYDYTTLRAQPGISELGLQVGFTF